MGEKPFQGNCVERIEMTDFFSVHHIAFPSHQLPVDAVLFV